MKTYEQGKGEKGKLKWNPNPSVVQALNAALYSSFKVYYKFLLIILFKIPHF